MVKPKLIYIVSPRYSGSTLLSFLFACHPEIATIGERKKFCVKTLVQPTREVENKHDTCSCGKTFSECSFWQKIKHELKGKATPNALRVDFAQFKIFRNSKLNCGIFGILEPMIACHLNWHLIPFSSRLKSMCMTNFQLIQIVLELTSRNVFVDSSKPIRHALALSTIPDFDFYVVNLLRDPRAQVASAMKYNDWSVADASRRLEREYRHNARIFDKFKVPRFDLAYETLCVDPQNTMKNILTFVGISPQVSLDFRKPQVHIMGNASMRHGKDNKIEQRNDWKQRFTSEEAEMIARVNRRLLAQLETLTH